MDPTANFIEQLRIRSWFKTSAKTASSLAIFCARERLAELQESLHEWLAKGGFPPDKAAVEAVKAELA